jgi:sugar phosphate isomerase/epimerase
VKRPITLFTGQWADLPLSELLPHVRNMGFDGVELACWGDHFDIAKANTDDAYIAGKWRLLRENHLDCRAISNHLVGQAVCDRIDERHQAILPPEVWGEGDPESVRRRAAEVMVQSARACRRFMDARPKDLPPLTRKVVNGFTGSSIWHALYAFPPTPAAYIQRGFDDFAARWLPILDSFEREGVNFALEVHPTEIAFDLTSAKRALAAIGHHPRFGFNYDPSHFAYQGVDYIRFIREFGERIFHVHLKDVWWGRGDGTTGVFGGHTEFCDPSRYWDFRSLGRGMVDFEAIIVALNDVGYRGPLSIEWEDGRMDRFHGARESCAFARRLDFPVNASNSFDAAFSSDSQP